MLITCWSVKGGVGTTVVAASLAVAIARRSGGVLVTDLAGDVAHALGAPEPVGPGVAEWLAAGASVPPDALLRLATPVGPGVDLVARGRAPITRGREPVLVSVLGRETRPVVVDAGRLDGPDDGGAVGCAVAAAADRSLLVLRPCSLALARARELPIGPTGIVLVREPGRALDRADVESVTGVPVVAELGVDPAVARVLDAGLLASRLPRSYAAAIERLA